MRLFQRTLLYFIAVIGLQALLGGAAIAALFGSMQAKDVAREIGDEARNAFESFHSWKLAFWKEINEIAEDAELSSAVALSSGSPTDEEAVVGKLRSRLAGSGVEAALLKDDIKGLSRLLLFEIRDPIVPEPDRLRDKKVHPYVEIVSAKGGFWFVGVVRVSPASRRPLELFILKRIDGFLVSHLSYDPMIAVTVCDSSRSVAGRYEGPAAGAKNGPAASVAAEDFLRFSRAQPPENTYTLYPRLEGRRGAYAAVMMTSGPVRAEGGEDTIRLAVTLSMAEYQDRAARINEVVFAVSLFAAGLTIVLALGLSRSIASPIRRLAEAMRLVGEGDFATKLGHKGGGEIGELLSGFNGMARKLEADKREAEAYIAQIVGLKEYGDGIINAIREGLAVVSVEGRIESANRAFLELFALSEAGTLGSSLAEIPLSPFDSEVLDMCSRVLRDREALAGILRRTEDGRAFELKLYPLSGADRPRCILVVEDVGDRLAYEERVIRAEKLASIGMLSAGVAHEINNPLSSILSNVQNLIEEAGDPAAAEPLRLVERETLRIARIVRQLLDFSAMRPAGSNQGERVSCEPNAVVCELVRLVGYPFHRDSRIHLDAELDPSCERAAISEDELKQVLLNLIKNALQAIGSEGRILVRTAAGAEGIEISVSDSGPGIPEEIMGRIFDPFFTTKSSRPTEGEADREAGIGLGLSVAWGIVATRGGSIRAENGNERGEGRRGATMRVLIPEAAKEAP